MVYASYKLGDRLTEEEILEYEIIDRTRVA